MPKANELPMARINIRIPAQDYKALLRLSERTRVTVSDYVRDGIDHVLRKHRRQRLAKA